ncbi:MAG: Zn-ribbon domain-containing OB-fold protein [Candidatus Binatia bacterium]
MSEDLGRRHLPDPHDPELAPFWEGCRAGELRIPRCRACGRFVWYPQLTCRGCGAQEHEWTRVSGRGSLFTWTVVHRAFLPGFERRVPFVTALVELEEDPALRMATLLAAAPGERLRIGLPVAVEFEPWEEGLVVPRFRVVGAAAERA